MAPRMGAAHLALPVSRAMLNLSTCSGVPFFQAVANGCWDTVWPSLACVLWEWGSQLTHTPVATLLGQIAHCPSGFVHMDVDLWDWTFCFPSYLSLGAAGMLDAGTVLSSLSATVLPRRLFVWWGCRRCSHNAAAL